MRAAVRAAVGFFAAALLLATASGVRAESALLRSLAAAVLGLLGALFVATLNSGASGADETAGPNDGGQSET